VIVNEQVIKEETWNDFTGTRSNRVTNDLFFSIRRQVAYNKLMANWVTCSVKTALCVVSPYELLGFPNSIIISLNLFLTQNSNKRISTEFQLFVISNWIGFEIQVADWLLVSLCYWSSYQHHTDLCNQRASYTWNYVACTYILRNGERNFYQIIGVSFGVFSMWLRYLN